MHRVHIYHVRKVPINQNGSTVGKIEIGERALHPREQMFGWTPENESSANIL